ncbi:hypothetical protein FA13DRAFT_1875690 [Coprinellus micaceus]|uniref:Uncharacterized protein n=1 Tax=Coprinellus micaceus TaxID=71717 RepID=A0A4Y7S375_COPMI|nr:hypothetical protein FA13DRAFT_1875690 [Coprinellus micaceus]
MGVAEERLLKLQMNPGNENETRRLLKITRLSNFRLWPIRQEILRLCKLLPPPQAEEAARYNCKIVVTNGLGVAEFAPGQQTPSHDRLDATHIEHLVSSTALGTANWCTQRQQVTWLRICSSPERYSRYRRLVAVYMSLNQTLKFGRANETTLSSSPLDPPAYTRPFSRPYKRPCNAGAIQSDTGHERERPRRASEWPSACNRQNVSSSLFSSEAYS